MILINTVVLQTHTEKRTSRIQTRDDLLKSEQFEAPALIRYYFSALLPKLIID